MAGNIHDAKISDRFGGLISLVSPPARRATTTNIRMTSASASGSQTPRVRSPSRKNAACADSSGLLPVRRAAR